MKVYLRILGYLRPHAGVLAAAAAATLVFAGLDAFSFVLIIPFLRALFGGAAGGAPDGAAAGGIGRVVDRTLGRFVEPTADPLSALQAIILFILVVWNPRG